MKRTLLVLFVAAVMALGLVACAQAECEEHYALCTNPTTCLDCGATNVECWLVHSDLTYTHTATTHTATCSSCGKVYDAEEHYTGCTEADKTYCLGCNASGVECEVYHHYDSENYKSDANVHWMECIDCGVKEDIAEHYAYCDAPNVCSLCGYTGEIEDIIHNTEWENYESDAEMHWLVCEGCGEIADEDTHFTACDPGGPCLICGTAGNFENYHFSSNLELEIDAKGHKETCVECNVLVEEGSHYTFCDLEDTSFCVYCGYESSSIPVEHYISEEGVKFDQKNHWGTCVWCGETVKEAHSFGKEGCWCGASKATYYYNNTACSFGPRFRDQENPVTDKWFMYTPVDLSKDGTQTFDLIASNVYVIGKVSVTVADGKLTVTYKLVSNEIKVSSEFLTVIPALEDVTTVDQEAFTAYAFGEEIDMKAVLGDSTTALIYICNVVDYNTGMDGVSVKVM